ncbi:MAG: outer rane adhesin like protein [Planctomycetaceae bacterium]|nr:outer rane adhesin like protein [Planctomycetaceae bacterium]
MATTLDGETGAYNYSPFTDYNGPDSFSFQTQDGTLDSNTETVSVTVTAVNDAPGTQNLSVTSDEDAIVNSSVAASDLDSATQRSTQGLKFEIFRLNGNVPRQGMFPRARPEHTLEPLVVPATASWRSV